VSVARPKTTATAGPDGAAPGRTGDDAAMLVDVVLMREEGKKLSPTDVRTRAPIRGHLCITTFRGSSNYGAEAERTDATVTDVPIDPQRPLTNLILCALEHVRITRLQGDSFVLAGRERIGVPGSGGQELPQAWWVRSAKRT
jgi:hypothetical protein